MPDERKNRGFRKSVRFRGGSDLSGATFVHVVIPPDRHKRDCLIIAAIVKITVTGAHTYVSNGILSHNIKAEQSLDPEA